MAVAIDKILEGAKETILRLKNLPAPKFALDWADYTEIESSEKILSDLTSILQLDTERKLEGEKNELLPVYAWRILSQWRATQAIPVLVEYLISADKDDDWTLNELPRAIAKFGALAIPELRKALIENTIFREDVWNYVAIEEALEEIGKNFSDEKGKVCDILREKLGDCELNSPTLNAFLISSLVNLMHFESLAEIKTAYSKDLVDKEIHDWEYVREKLGSRVELPESISRMEISSTNFVYSGDERFQKLLKVVGSSFNTDELRCFLLGSVLAIDLVPQSQIIKEVLIDNYSEDVEFETQGQAAYFTRELFGLWNELSKYQDNLCKLPSLECDHIHHGSECDETVEWSVYSFRQRMQLEYFLEGLEKGGTKASSFDDGQSGQFITLLRAKLEALDTLEKNKDVERTSPTKDLITDIRAFWDANFLPFAEACKKARLHKMEKRQFVADHRKVGRNDSCPCGSGNKFKKCCLLKYN